MLSAGAPNTLVKKPLTMIGVPNKVWVVEASSKSILSLTLKTAPVIRLMRMKAKPAAKAPPARSLAQFPPIASAKRMCKLTMIAQPMFSKTPPVVTKNGIDAKLIAKVFPILIIRPAAGITAITTMRALPNFCQNSKLKNFFILCLLSISANCLSTLRTCCRNLKLAKWQFIIMTWRFQHVLTLIY